MALGDLGTYEGYAFRLGASSGAMAAALAANSPVFSFRNATATRKVRILKVRINAAVGATAFTAGAGTFAMFAARNFTASDTGGTGLGGGTAGNNNNKLRTSQNSSFILTGTGGDVRVATTGTLAAGTRTLDANPIGNINFGASATAGSIMVADIPIYEDQASMYGIPLVLAQNEGFVIQATVPATGVWAFGVNVQWVEIDGGPNG